jgi:hypothetical protein
MAFFFTVHYKILNYHANFQFKPFAGFFVFNVVNKQKGVIHFFVQNSVELDISASGVLVNLQSNKPVATPVGAPAYYSRLNETYQISDAE